MAAPLYNQNRRGKTGQSYNLTIPRLKCDTCAVKDKCPFFKPGTPVCIFLKKIRNKKAQLENLDDVQSLRRQVVLDTIVQLEVGGLLEGVKNSKEMLMLRKLAMEHLKELERDMFNQSIKKVENEQNTILGSIIAEIRNSPLPQQALPEPKQTETIEAEFRVEEPANLKQD